MCLIQKLISQFVIILVLVFITEVAVVALGYVYRAKVRKSKHTMHIYNTDPQEKPKSC